MYPVAPTNVIMHLGTHSIKIPAFGMLIARSHAICDHLEDIKASLRTVSNNASNMLDEAAKTVNMKE